MQPQKLWSLVEELNQASSVEEFHSACSRICGNFDLDHFLYCARIPTSLVRPLIVIISGYPQEWRHHYNEQGYMEIDPTIKHCEHNVTPLVWDDALAAGREDSKIRKFLRDASDFGLKAGISLPVHGVQRETGMLNFSSAQSAETSRNRIRQSLPYLQMLSTYSHEALRRIITVQEILPSNPELTPRETECLLWAAEGKTTWETSQILGISERTVIFHLQNASNKLNVNSRQHAVARAISLGLLTPHLSF